MVENLEKFVIHLEYVLTFQKQNLIIMKLHYFLFILASIFLFSCGEESFKKNPVDIIIRDMPKEVESFSVILFDMEVEGTFVRTYKHQYKIITEKASKISEETTGWFEVPKEFFKQHENNMGMEIVSKSKDGKISKVAAPPGYSNYVGNPQYGSWSSNGVWTFFTQYAMMSMMFNMMTYPVQRSYWNDYRSNYYGRSSYYGPTNSDGRTTYGSQSSYARKINANSKWKSSSLSGSNRRGSSFFSGAGKSSRNTGRWGSGSRSGGGFGGGFRSRSGGFGK